MERVRGPGRAVLACVLLAIAGSLNVIYGIAAISNSHFYSSHPQYVFGDLKTWGWIGLVIGVLELVASASLAFGGTFGRWVAILVGSLAAIEAVFAIPAAPFLALGLFFVSLWIVHGLTLVYEPEPEVYQRPPSPVDVAPPMTTEPRPMR